MVLHEVGPAVREGFSHVFLDSLRDFLAEERNLRNGAQDQHGDRDRGGEQQCGDAEAGTEQGHGDEGSGDQTPIGGDLDPVLGDAQHGGEERE